MSDRDLLHALRELYATIDAAMEAMGLLQRVGHCEVGAEASQPQPFLLEVDLIRTFLQRTNLPWPEVEFDGVCPFLESGDCRIYEVRPFGCRTFSRGMQAETVVRLWRAQIDGLRREYAFLRCEPLRGYPLCFYPNRSASREDWVDAT